MSNERIQAIAGVVPTDVAETVVMQVWPSISALRLGQVLGRIYSVPLLVRVPLILATLWLVVILYVYQRFRRYTLTTRRIIVQRGVRAQPLQDLALEQLEEIRVRVRPGQAFYRAGDLELIGGEGAALVLPGVQCPETFRRNILAARDAYRRVTAAAARQQEEPTAA